MDRSPSTAHGGDGARGGNTSDTSPQTSSQRTTPSGSSAINRDAMIRIVQQALHDLNAMGIRVITVNVENSDGTRDAAVIMRGLVWTETPEGNRLEQQQ